jgi:hypothetical protein
MFHLEKKQETHLSIYFGNGHFRFHVMYATKVYSDPDLRMR